MEIHSLKASLTEQDLNDLARKYFPDDLGVEELRVAITAEGVLIKGEYPMLVTVAFETLWELSAAEGRLVARLARFRTLGMPMTVLKSLVMNLIASAAKKESWLGVEGDLVRVDAERLLTLEGLQARFNLTSVSCQAGVVVIEAGTL
jgi:hypothetical protein